MSVDCDSLLGEYAAANTQLEASFAVPLEPAVDMSDESEANESPLVDKFSVLGNEAMKMLTGFYEHEFCGLYAVVHEGLTRWRTTTSSQDGEQYKRVVLEYRAKQKEREAKETVWRTNYEARQKRHREVAAEVDEDEMGEMEVDADE